MALKTINHILMDIDTQYDFMMPDGALYVPGAQEIVPNLARIFDAARTGNVFVISSADCHPRNDPEFEQFSPHCLEGSPGQAKLDQTILDRRRVIRPGEAVSRPELLLDVCQQVIFYKTTFTVWSNPNAVRLIEALEVGEYIVFGVATDYCVRQAVLGLRERHRRVAVVGDAVRPVADATGRAAVAEMLAAGARWVTTDQVIGVVG
jgi:nicotinamidase/pyrazinamidase